MAGESKMTVMGMAAAAATTLAYASVSFVTSPGGGLSAPTRIFAHSGPSSAAAFAGETSGAYNVTACLAVGIAAGLATAARVAVVRRVTGVGPIAEYKDQPVFAGGIAGSEFGGFGRHEFDPAGLASRFPEHLAWYREAELKHSRVAMLACVGLLAPDLFRIPFDEFKGYDFNVVNAHSKLIGPGLGEGPMWGVLIFCAAIESNRFRELGLRFENLTLENAGDIGLGKSFLPKSEEGIAAIKVKELKNGRLAMMAFSGCITQAVLNGAPHFPFLKGF